MATLDWSRCPAKSLVTLPPGFGACFAPRHIDRVIATVNDAIPGSYTAVEIPFD